MDNIRYLSLIGDPRGISLEKEIDIRRGGDEDRPLHHPSHPIHLLTLQRESLGDRNIPIKREEGDIHLLLPLRQYPIVEFVTMADTREIDSPQAVQDPQVPQPKEEPNIQTMTPEQVIFRPSRDSGSDSESETWSFDRAINEVFRLLPPELCPRQTKEHAPAKPLSGIELLMESQSGLHRGGDPGEEVAEILMTSPYRSGKEKTTSPRFSAIFETYFRFCLRR